MASATVTSLPNKNVAITLVRTSELSSWASKKLKQAKKETKTLGIQKSGILWAYLLLDKWSEFAQRQVGSDSAHRFCRHRVIVPILQPSYRPVRRHHTLDVIRVDSLSLLTMFLIAVLFLHVRLALHDPLEEKKLFSEIKRIENDLKNPLPGLEFQLYATC